MFLLDQIGLVADGSQDSSSAKSICNYAQQVYNTMNLEIKYATAKAKIGDAQINSVDLT